MLFEAKSCVRSRYKGLVLLFGFLCGVLVENNQPLENWLCLCACEGFVLKFRCLKVGYGVYPSGGHSLGRLTHAKRGKMW